MIFVSFSARCITITTSAYKCLMLHPNLPWGGVVSESALIAVIDSRRLDNVNRSNKVALPGWCAIVCKARREVELERFVSKECYFDHGS